MRQLDEQLSELEKLQQAAQLIEEMSQGRLQVCPSVVGQVYIRPQHDSNLGMDMRIDSIPGQPHYRITFTVQLRRMGTDMVADDLRALLSEVGQTYLMLYGTAVDVTPYRKAVTQVGTAWGLPIPDTQRWLDLIRQEEIAVTQAAEPEKVNHVMEEKDLPINASGLQTLDNIWGLFETAVKLNSADGRREMYALARELSECQNLTDWIIKSQTENEGAQVSMACTQN